MARIACIGTALQNLYLVDHDDFTPPPVTIDAEVMVDKVTYAVGGSGVNTAVSLARHGHETILISNIAKDAAGSAILNTLNHEDIDSSYMNLMPYKNTGITTFLLDSKSKKHVALMYAGAAADFSNLDEKDLELISPDWLYATTLNGDMNTLRRFFEKAHAMGIKIMFNPGAAELSQPKKVIGLLEDVDILYVNKPEAAEIVPGVILTELLSRLNNYVKTVIVTDGAMGGIASNGAESYRFGIYEDIAVKDTVGAGDAFGAGFLAHFAADYSFKNSLIFASANATSVVSKISATKGVLTGQEPLHPMPIQKI